MHPVPAARDGLAVDGVGDVTGGEHARHAGLGRVAVAQGRAGDLDVAAFHVELPGEGRGVRLVADGDERAMHGEILRDATVDVTDADPGHPGLIA